MTATTAGQNQTRDSLTELIGVNTGSSRQTQAGAAVLTASEAGRATATGETSARPRCSFGVVLLRALSAFAV